MDPLTAMLLTWISVGIISLMTVVLIIVAERRDHARLYGDRRPGDGHLPPRKSQGTAARNTRS